MEQVLRTTAVPPQGPKRIARGAECVYILQDLFEVHSRTQAVSKGPRVASPNSAFFHTILAFVNSPVGLRTFSIPCKRKAMS